MKNDDNSKDTKAETSQESELNKTKDEIRRDKLSALLSFDTDSKDQQSVVPQYEEEEQISFAFNLPYETSIEKISDIADSSCTYFQDVSPYVIQIQTIHNL
jgi:hypothetical protein